MVLLNFTSLNPVRTEYVKQFVDLNGKKCLTWDVAEEFSRRWHNLGCRSDGDWLAEDALEVAKLHLLESGRVDSFVKVLSLQR